MLESNDLKKTYRGRWKSNTVTLLIGGNQGDRVSLLMQAIIEIASRIGTVSAASSLYETEPWGFEAEQNFLNQALVVDTDLAAEEVLQRALEIEKDLGRVRSEPSDIQNSKFKIHNYTSRPMDIDLIFYNNDIVDTPALQLPHPRMHLRRFVLQPLAQIMPDKIHPKFRKTISQLLAECTDEGVVKEYF
ncbi:MAG: 2-amino-4-hydroxy-6-hydroxymethyldihydropteridine diphosphokinase [Bacteroidales bacterium]|nr:2-amino-4-hydroxy-6-hydroxymethyldihydropteridine diphosphokinase [Bacteroidales bacterium]